VDFNAVPEGSMFQTGHAALSSRNVLLFYKTNKESEIHGLHKAFQNADWHKKLRYAKQFQISER